MAKKKPRNRYSKEFKSNAVKMSLKVPDGDKTEPPVGKI
jgi:hypothetical protein